MPRPELAKPRNATSVHARALGVLVGALTLGGTLGGLLGGGARRGLALVASAALTLVSVMWISALLVGRLALLTLVAGACLGGGALAAGLWSARRRASPSARPDRLLPLCGLALAVLGAAALFIWASVQFSGVATAGG